MEFLDATGLRTQVTPSNPLPVTGGGAATLPPDVTTSGSLGALNATLAINPGPRDTLVAAVSGTFVGTVSLQGSLDNTTWFTVNGPATWLNVATGAATTAITATGLWQSTISALPYVRLAMTSYTSGTATVVLDATDGNAMVALDAPLPAGDQVIGRAKVTDGTNVSVVKGGSTPAGTADAALAVTQSPNYVAASTGFGVTLGAVTGATVLKASAGSLLELDAFNPTAATVYLKLYDKASAAPVPGTDVPRTVIPIAAGQGIITELGQYGKRFGTGIAYIVTTGNADSDNTAPTAGVKVSGTYL